jgi:hypothetical protein
MCSWAGRSSWISSEPYAPDVDYVQYSGNDPSIIKLALKTGRMCGVTYGYSPRYKSKISHMVDCVHFTDKWAAILDNNYPGEDQYEWMPPDEFLNRLLSPCGPWASRSRPAHWPHP